MVLEPTTFFIFSVVAASVAFAFAVYIYTQGTVAKVRIPAALLSISSGIWILSIALEARSIALPAKLLWGRMQYFGILILPTAWLVFIVRYTGQDHWIRRRGVLLLVFPPVLFAFLIATNPYHRQFWATLYFDVNNPATPLVKVPGPLYWIFIFHSYLIAAAGIVVLGRRLLRVRHLHRSKALAVLAAVTATWLVSALGTLGVIPNTQFDPTAVMLTFAVPAAVWAFRQMRSGTIVTSALGATIDGMGDGVIVLDAQNQILSMNPASERLLRKLTGEVVGGDVGAIWPDLPDLIASLPDGVDGASEVSLQSGEEEHTYDVRISPVNDWDGQLVSRVVVLRDVSERKRADAKLRESEARYRLLAENSTDLITRHSPHGNFIYASPASRAILGYEPEELERRSIFEFIHPDDKDKLLKEHVKIISEPNVHINTYRLRRKDGMYIWVEMASRTIYAMRRDGGGPEEIISVSRDITERKQAEEALLAERERLVVTLQGIADGVVALDFERRVVLANPVAEALLSELADAQVGDILTCLGDKSLDTLLYPPPHGENFHEVVLIGSQPRTFEVVAQPTGAGLYASGWVLVIRDVTIERETQHRAQLQERLAAVGQLAAGIAHDFNNILGAIILYSEMALQTGELSSKNRERIRTVFQQAERAATLTRQILDFSRRTVMDQAPLDLGLFLRETEQLLSRTLPENIRLSFECDSEPYVVSADPTRVQQILMNLALNARDAMPQGGQLYFELSRLHVPVGEAPPYRDMAPGHWVQLSVTDSGMGIPPEIEPHIFEPFYTTKDPGDGSGLGLAQVYGIVKQHGGFIDVDSRVGIGTTFIIYLPAIEVPVESSLAYPSIISANGRKEVVLVVEDDVATLDAVNEILETLNYAVIKALDGQEALEIIQARNGQVDLVLSDLVMPVMGGVKLYREIEGLEVKTKVIFMTGYPLGRGTRDLLDEKKVTWVQKPLRSDTLARVIRDVLDEVD